MTQQDREKMDRAIFARNMVYSSKEDELTALHFAVKELEGVNSVIVSSLWSQLIERIRTLRYEIERDARTPKT